MAAPAAGVSQPVALVGLHSQRVAHDVLCARLLRGHPGCSGHCAPRDARLHSDSFRRRCRTQSSSEKRFKAADFLRGNVRYLCNQVTSQSDSTMHHLQFL